MTVIFHRLIKWNKNDFILVVLNNVGVNVYHIIVNPLTAGAAYIRVLIFY